MPTTDTPQQGYRSPTFYTTTHYSQLPTPAAPKGKTFFYGNNTAVHSNSRVMLFPPYASALYLPPKLFFLSQAFLTKCFFNHGFYVNTNLYEIAQMARCRPGNYKFTKQCNSSNLWLKKSHLESFMLIKV